MDVRQCRRGNTWSDRLGEAGKWSCTKHSGRVKENRWTCCGRIYAHEYLMCMPTTFGYGDTFRSRQAFAKRTFPPHRGCVPCDHGAGETIEFTEIIDAIRSGTIDGNEIMLRPGFQNEEGRPRLIPQEDI